jgi:hypothetical protein
VRRSEILATFEIENSRITTPGPYAGEPIYVPYFWEKGVDGWADAEADDGDYIFVIMPEDRQEFPELGSKNMIRIHQEGSGLIFEVAVH